MKDCIKRLVLDAMKKYNVSGLAISIIKNHEVYMSDAFGVIDVATSQTANKDSLFYIASATKAFTALSIGMMVESGKLKFQDPIKSYVTNFETADKYITENATIIDILSHRTGIDELPILGDNSITRADLYNRLKEFTPNKPFRTTYQYSNSLYAIAGYIVEILTGMQWEEFVAQNIFAPLEMSNSDFAFIYGWEHENRSKLYYQKDGKINTCAGSDKKTYDTWGPAGSINSNADDMCKWLMFLINKGEYKNKRLISQENYDIITSPHTIAWNDKSDKNFSTACYCLGWVNQFYKGENILWHNGSLGSFVSFMPNQNIGVSILTNMNSQLGKELALAIYDLMTTLK